MGYSRITPEAGMMVQHPPPQLLIHLHRPPGAWLVVGIRRGGRVGATWTTSTATFSRLASHWYRFRLDWRLSWFCSRKSFSKTYIRWSWYRRWPSSDININVRSTTKTQPWIVVAFTWLPLMFLLAFDISNIGKPSYSLCSRPPGNEYLYPYQCSHTQFWCDQPTRTKTMPT